MAVLVVILDQLSKFLILASLSVNSSTAVIPGIFNLTLVFNPGISFGLFRDHDTVLFALITASLGVLFFLALRMQRAGALARWAMALILGGAVGNWIDRLRFGAVVDFLDFRVWPVFNLADSAITIGVCLYLIFFAVAKKSSGLSQAPNH